jgi:hypothetical protein
MAFIAHKKQMRLDFLVVQHDGQEGIIDLKSRVVLDEP